MYHGSILVAHVGRRKLTLALVETVQHDGVFVYILQMRNIIVFDFPRYRLLRIAHQVHGQ